MARRKLTSARVVITGASSGIGRALAEQLAASGARVVVTARRAERLTQLVESLPGYEVYALPGDITSAAFRAELLAFAQEKFGALDVLINNAGAGAIGKFVDSSTDTLRRIMELDFFAPVELVRSALPLLEQGTKPIIVNVTSVLAHRAVPKKSEYCAAKFALHGMSDALRAELAPQGIDVLMVSPSTTESEFFDVAAGDKGQLPWLKIRGMTSKAVAKAAVKAIRAGRHEVILSPGGKLLVWLDRLCPPLMNRLVAKWG